VSIFGERDVPMVTGAGEERVREFGWWGGKRTSALGRGGRFWRVLGGGNDPRSE